MYYDQAIDKVLVAARSGGEKFAPLAGHARGVEACPGLFYEQGDKPARICSVAMPNERVSSTPLAASGGY